MRQTVPAQIHLSVPISTLTAVTTVQVEYSIPLMTELTPTLMVFAIMATVTWMEMASKMNAISIKHLAQIVMATTESIVAISMTLQVKTVTQTGYRTIVKSPEMQHSIATIMES